MKRYYELDCVTEGKPIPGAKSKEDRTPGNQSSSQTWWLTKSSNASEVQGYVSERLTVGTPPLCLMDLSDRFYKWLDLTSTEK